MGWADILALAAARAADAALAHGEQKPLLGIPMTVKESYNIAGLPTTWGIPEQKDFTPTEGALSIARVKDAGAVILGKTNVPLGLGDWQNYNDIYGTTNNPYDLTRAARGSSRRIVGRARRRLRREVPLHVFLRRPAPRVRRAPRWLTADRRVARAHNALGQRYPTLIECMSKGNF